MKKLIYYELRKIFSKRLAQIAFVGLLILSAVLSLSNYLNKHSSDGISAEGSGRIAVKIDQKIAAKYEGILTDEKIEQMMYDFAPECDLNGINAAYFYQNATQSAAFARFSDMNGNWNGSSVSDVFSDEEIRIGYVDGWLSTSKNLPMIFTILSLMIIIMLAPVYSGEYEGIDNIILTSKYGKTKCSTAKAVASILTAVFTTTVIVDFNLVISVLLYGKSGLDCSILFAPRVHVENFVPFNITCGELLNYQILLAYTGAVSVTGITLLISAVSKKTNSGFGRFYGNFPFSYVAVCFRNKSIIQIYYAPASVSCARNLSYVGRSNE